MMTSLTIRPAAGSYTVRAKGAILGETSRALEVIEGDRAAVIYVPREDMAMAFLDRSERQTTCPHKGVASYYSVVTPEGRLEDAVWSYETPEAGAEAIRGYLAFYPAVTVKPL